MSKILVTGATGFVGSNLVKSLSNTLGIITLGRNKADYQWPTLSNIPNGIRAYVHLAGKAHDLKATANDSEYFSVNRDLTIHLFDHFFKSDAELFVYMSSVKAATDEVVDVLTEDVIPQPKTPYGQSKQEAEEQLLAVSLPQGKRLVILRPCMIHGPGNKGNLNLLYKFVQKGIPYPLAAFENKRSFLSIDNLTFAIKHMIEHTEFASGVYNIADDETLSTKELVQLIGESIGKSAKTWSISKKMIEGTAIIGDTLKLPLNTHRLQKLTESYVVSNQKIKQALRISAFPVSAKAGLTQTVKSFSK